MLILKWCDIVNCIDKVDNFVIEFVKINVLVIIECMDDFVCDDFDCGFYICFIFWLMWVGRKSCSVVVF